MNTNTTHVMLPTDPTHEEFRLMLVVSSDKTLPKELMDRIRKQVQLSLPEIAVGESKTLRKICDKDFWKSITKGEKIAAGQCMSYLVEGKCFPLIPDGQTKSFSNRYRRI